MDETERKLATVEVVGEVRAIPDADAIVAVRIRGWDVVAKLGELAAGDLCVYVEVDALLDVADERFAFLAPRGVRTDASGRSGHVLRTARLRGQVSQGLALPVAAFPELGPMTAADAGRDVTAALGIVKWDPPVPAHLSGLVAGPWPSWIARTDEERAQNLPGVFACGLAWAATEKVDGSSTTVFVDGDVDGVCSRSLNLAEERTNTFWRLARELDLHARLRTIPSTGRVALQGESYGDGIQANPLAVKGQHLAVFNLVVDGRSVEREQWPTWLLDLSVPVRDDLTFPPDLAGALAQVAALPSRIGSGRPAEGVVWRAVGTDRVTLADGQIVRPSFKVISNAYLVKLAKRGEG